MSVSQLAIPAIASLCMHVHIQFAKTESIRGILSKSCSEESQMVYSGNLNSAAWSRIESSASVFRDFRVASFNWKSGSLSSSSFEHIEFGKANFEGLSLSGIDIYNSRLGALTVVESKMSAWNWVQTTADKVVYESSLLQDAVFERDSLKQLNLDNTGITNVDLRRTEIGLINAIATLFSFAEFNDVKISNMDILNSAIEDSKFTHTSWLKAKFVDTEISRSKWSNSVFNHTQMDNVSISEVEFRETPEFFDNKFYRSNFKGVVFDRVKLDSVVFSNLDFSFTRFVNSTVRNSTFENVHFGAQNDLTGLIISPDTEFKNCTYDKSVRFPSGFDPQARGLRQNDAL